MSSPATPPIYKLSQDLIDHIIDILVAMDELEAGGYWKSQWKSLNTYSLINRAFLPRCNSYMFKRIDFNTDSIADQHPRCVALYKILKNRPILAGYVQEVNISLSRRRNTEWLVEDDAFLGVMTVLGSSRSPVQIFRLFGDYPSHPLPEALQFIQRVAKPVFLPFITFLYLKDLLNIPVDVVKSCVHLTDLTLDNINFAYPSVHSSGSPVMPVPRLTKLDYTDSGNAIKRFLVDGCESARIDFSDLRILIVCINNLADIECAQDVLNLSPSLENLFLIHQLEKEGSPALIERLNLGGSSNLLFLSLDVIFVDSDAEDPLSHARTLLSTIPKENQLVQINLSILVGFENEGKPDRCFYADWESFTAIIEKVANGKPLALFLHLRYEDQKMIGHGRDDVRRRLAYVNKACYSVLNELLEKRMPAIAKKGNIKIFLDQTVTRPLAYF